MKSTSHIRAQRARLRAIASAPAVPSTTEAIVVQTATISALYQRSE
jgi:hypothetical protein